MFIKNILKGCAVAAVWLIGIILVGDVSAVAQNLCLILTVLIIVYIAYSNGYFVQHSVKKHIKKEFGRIVYFEKVSLSNNNGIKENNLKFDKKMLEYKKHFLCFTKKEVIIIGYSPFSKTHETPKTYQKVYKHGNISGIALIFSKCEYTTTEYEIVTTHRTVTTQYGTKYKEQVDEQVPYSEQRNVDVLWLMFIRFNNTVVDKIYFDFEFKKYNQDKRESQVIKINKASKKVDIPCKTAYDDGGKNDFLNMYNDEETEQ